MKPGTCINTHLVTELNLQKLGSDSHLVAPSISLADMTVFFLTVATCFKFGLSAEMYPELGEYYALLKEQPSVKASWDKDKMHSKTSEILTHFTDTSACNVLVSTKKKKAFV